MEKYDDNASSGMKQMSCFLSCGRKSHNNGESVANIAAGFKTFMADAQKRWFVLQDAAQ